MVLERGTLLNNRYRIVEILGQGGMGAVYRAVDENLGVEIALKENLFTTEEYARQFRREAAILASLRHPNLTRVTDHFEIEGQGQYLVMDFIEGEDLRQRMDRIGLLNEEEAIMIGAAICDALSYLDSLNPPIVHRDIKPGNVKINPQGQIFLVDFGLAKIIQSDQVTTTGARAMTPGYSPPEQYGTARTDHRSDIFSLGATLYAALTGAIPEDALSRTMGQIGLTPIRRRSPRISRRLAAVIEKSLEVRPDDRYQSAEEFKQALLSVRGITSRRRQGEFALAPESDRASGQNGLNGSLALAADPVSPGVQPEVRSPSPLPGSYVISPAPASIRPRPRSRRKRSAWMVLALLAFILVLISLITSTFYPAWPALAISLLLPKPATAAVIAAVPATHTPSRLASPTLASPTSQLPTALPTVRQTAIVASPSPTSLSAVLPPSPQPTATPMGGGAGQIAFASDRTGITQVWVMNVDGSDLRQVTDMTEGACQPAWSPDGTRLVFISPCIHNQESYPGAGMFVVKYDGSELTPLPTVPGGDYDPSWSPDGNFIAFTSLRNSGRPRIYRLNLEDGSVERLSQQYDRDMQPSWSPDGLKVVFTTFNKGVQQIWTMSPDGSGRETFSFSGPKIDSNPEWSPDGEVILFNQMDTPGSVPKLAAGSYKEGEYNEYRYNLGPLPVREPNYSPDALWLVFESWPEGSNHDIYIMAVNGSGRAQVTDWARFDFDPTWRPVLNHP
jgi:serine/threonine protein kinase